MTSPSKKYAKKPGFRGCLFIVTTPRRKMYLSSSAMRRSIPFSKKYHIILLSLWEICISCSLPISKDIIVRLICWKNRKERAFFSFNLNNMLPIWHLRWIFQLLRIQTRFLSHFFPADYSMSWCVGAIEITSILQKRWPMRCWIFYQ